jgi:predicted transcriptional regulator
MEITDQEILGLELINKDHSITIDSDSQIEEIVKALSSRTRRKILRQIQIEPMDVSAIAANLKMTEANISAQIKKLQKAGLVNCEYRSGQHGVRKISTLKYNKLIIRF